MGARPLAGLRVLEVAEGPAAAFCGLQFASWGAEVVLLEPQGGSPLRGAAPLARMGSKTVSAAFEALAAGKRSVRGPPTPDDLDRALAGADVLICERPQDFLRATALSLEDVAARYPHLVVLAISAFGRTGPRSGDTAGAAELEALSGYLWLSGDPEGPPLPMPGRILSFAAGVSAFVAGLAALIARRAHGWGEQVDVSELETVASFIPWLRELAQPSSRESGTPEGARLLACADGVLSMTPAVAAYWPAYQQALGLTAALPPWPADMSRRDAVAAATEALAPHLSTEPVEPLFARLQALGVPCAPVRDLAAVLSDPQLAARDFFQAVRDGFGGQSSMAGPPARLTDDAPSSPPPAERLGASTLGALEWTPRPAPSKAASPAAPLAGFRVLDLTQAWIGPLAGQMLADLGADVVKVESPVRPDVWRYLGQAPESAQPAPTAPLNRSGYFNGVNRNKRGLAIDLGRSAGRAVFGDLVRDADLLLENFTPGVMPKLALSFSALAALNPNLVMTSFSGFGTNGPLAAGKTNGAAIEALAGWCELHRGPHGAPKLMGAYPADPICGLQMAACALVGLWRRLQSGAGVHVDGSMLEAAAGYITDELRAAALVAGGAERMSPSGDQVVPGPGEGAWSVRSASGALTPVRTPGEVLAGGPLHDCSWFIRVETPDADGAWHAGRAWRFHRARLPAYAAAPKVGQHNGAILKRELGLTDAQIASLAEDGVIGSLP